MHGIAKGAGMIHPQLATMLAFLLTDTDLPKDPAPWSRRIADRTFHRLTVDGDTSPNDTVLLWSSARHEVAETELDDAMHTVAADLCRQIAADGEGATRALRIIVSGARTDAEATAVGRAIGTSMLAKTAITGRDPNWGRILSAAGRTARFDCDRARVWIGAHDVFAAGRPLPDNEPAASRYLDQNPEVQIGIDLGVGTVDATIWSCDLTQDYISINADYRS